MAARNGVNRAGESAVGGVGGEEVQPWASGRTPQAVTNYRYNGLGMRILWQPDLDAGGTLEERRYFCQNWRADVVAMTKSDGTPLEYVLRPPCALGAQQWGQEALMAANRGVNGRVNRAPGPAPARLIRSLQSLE